MLSIHIFRSSLRIKLLALTLAIFILAILVLAAYIFLNQTKIKSEQKKAEILTEDIKLNISGTSSNSTTPDFIEKKLLIINNMKLDDKKRYGALSDIAFYYASTYSTLHDPSIRLFSIKILGKYAKQEFPRLYNRSVFEIPCSDTQCGQDLTTELKNVLSLIDKSSLSKLAKDTITDNVKTAGYMQDTGISLAYKKDGFRLVYAQLMGTGDPIASEAAKQLSSYALVKYNIKL